jgi:hypothetical protein
MSHGAIFRCLFFVPLCVPNYVDHFVSNRYPSLTGAEREQLTVHLNERLSSIGVVFNEQDAAGFFRLGLFGVIMNYAVKKRYVPASQRFDEHPKLKTMRRDEFTLEEYANSTRSGASGLQRPTSRQAFGIAPLPPT